LPETEDLCENDFTPLNDGSCECGCEGTSSDCIPGARGFEDLITSDRKGFYCATINDYITDFYGLLKGSNASCKVCDTENLKLPPGVEASEDCAENWYYYDTWCDCACVGDGICDATAYPPGSEFSPVGVFCDSASSVDVPGDFQGANYCELCTEGKRSSASKKRGSGASEFNPRKISSEFNPGKISRGALASANIQVMPSREKRKELIPYKKEEGF